MKRDRDTGKGLPKVNTPFKFREDLYSLHFITLIKPVYKLAVENKTLRPGAEAKAKNEYGRQYRQVSYLSVVFVLFIM